MFVAGCALILHGFHDPVVIFESVVLDMIIHGYDNEKQNVLFYSMLIVSTSNTCLAGVYCLLNI